MQVLSLTFNAFQENTYIVFDDSKECIIFDPGCSNSQENQQLLDEISRRNLKPVRLINTHCHIDHILGNKFVAETYNLELEAHEGEVQVLNMGSQVSQMYGIPYTTSPPIAKFIADGDKIMFGKSTLEAIYTPGHSPASLSFHHKESKQLIAGDVLFKGSIGRTDLPGGDYNTLISSIKNRVLTLGDDIIVYSGHGPSTNTGYEKRNNPFLQG